MVEVNSIIFLRRYAHNLRLKNIRLYRTTEAGSKFMKSFWATFLHKVALHKVKYFKNLAIVIFHITEKSNFEYWLAVFYSKILNSFKNNKNIFSKFF